MSARDLASSLPKDLDPPTWIPARIPATIPATIPARIPTRIPARIPARLPTRIPAPKSMRELRARSCMMGTQTLCCRTRNRAASVADGVDASGGADNADAADASGGLSDLPDGTAAYRSIGGLSGLTRGHGQFHAALLGVLRSEPDYSVIAHRHCSPWRYSLAYVCNPIQDQPLEDHEVRHKVCPKEIEQLSKQENGQPLRRILADPLPAIASRGGQ